MSPDLMPLHDWTLEMKKKGRRQHFTSRFYLRHFAEPMGSENLQVFTKEECKWRKRSSKSIAFESDFYATVYIDGIESNGFDCFFKKYVEDPAAPVLQRIARSRVLNKQDRPILARFIGFTAARSPDLIRNVRISHEKAQSLTCQADFDKLLQQYCTITGQVWGPHIGQQLLHEDALNAAFMWGQSLEYRFLYYNWHLLCTTRHEPFVTSDRPVFAEKELDDSAYLVSLPVSSEVAVLIFDGGSLNPNRDKSREVATINVQTLRRADRFVACCQQTFPGDEILNEWRK